MKFALSLLTMFKNDPKLMEERAIQIIRQQKIFFIFTLFGIRQICLLLEPKDVFSSLAHLLNSQCDYSNNKDESGTDEDMEFTSKMVTLLNRFILYVFL